MAFLKKKMTYHEEVDTEGSWAISYGDMITLLLTFFIIFFTIDPSQTKQNIKLKLSLVDTLEKKSSADVAQGVTEPFSVGKEKDQGADPQILKEWNGVVHDRGHHVIVEFPYVSFFKDGQESLTQEGAHALSKFVNVYMPYAGNYFLSIRAFADQRKVMQKPGRRFKDNLELTALRSVATMRALQKAGIPLSRIRVGGYGELALTAQELESIPKEKRGPASHHDLARKVVIVIEPEVRNEKHE